jgi:transcriptional regulator with XRE-family HTH domain
MQRFGEKLRTLRQRRGMSVRELTSALGYTGHGYIYDIEIGKKKPNVEFVLRVADLFNVTTDQLLRDAYDLDPVPETAESQDNPA